MNKYSQDLISNDKAEQKLQYSHGANTLASLDVENLYIGNIVKTNTPPDVILPGGGYGNAICGKLEISPYGEDSVLPSIKINRHSYIYTSAFFQTVSDITEHTANHLFQNLEYDIDENQSGAIIDSLVNPVLNVDYELKQ